MNEYEIMRVSFTNGIWSASNIFNVPTQKSEEALEVIQSFVEKMNEITKEGISHDR